MDALLEALAKLLGVFKEPVQVVLLIVIAAESFLLWKGARFVMDRYDKEIDTRTAWTNAITGLTELIKEKVK